jgi:hypothetical protein
MALLTVLDGYYAFATRPTAQPLARFVSLTGSFGVPALATAVLTCTGCLLVVLLRRRSRVSLGRSDSFALMLLLGTLSALGLLDLAPQKLPFAAELLVALVIGAALGYVALGPVRSPGAALALWIAGLILLGSTPLYEWVEIQLMGNSDYYSFDPTSRIYVFDRVAWRHVWIVSRAQELSELLALLCFVVSMLCVLGGTRAPRRLPNIE